MTLFAVSGSGTVAEHGSGRHDQATLVGFSMGGGEVARYIARRFPVARRRLGWKDGRLTRIS